MGGVMGRAGKEKKSGTKINIRKMTLIWLVLGLLCVLYGLSVLAVGSGTAFFAVWLGLGACLFLFSLFAQKGLWRKLPKAARRLFLCLVVAGAAFFFVTEGFVFSGFTAKGSDGLDYIIVLGAQVYESGPSKALQYRLEEAVDYLNENPDTICIVSGGQGANEPFSEARGMADYLISRGIDESRLLLEDQSENTVANIRNSMEFIDPEKDSVGIVTNNFHVFRAMGIAKKQGIVHVEGISANSDAWYLPNNMFREFFGVLKDTLKGNMSW